MTCVLLRRSPMRRAILLSIIISGCATAPPGPPASKPPPTPGATVVLTRAPLAVPQPPSFLPKPYADAKIAASTPDEVAYAKYLRETELFADEGICDRNLNDRLRGVAKPDSVGSEWVTPPFLAWGGIWNVGAVVGPVQYLFSIKEAHVVYEDMQGKQTQATYSCYVQYAKQEEQSVWRQGFLKYGYGLKDGHEKYVSFPARQFSVARPGLALTWESGIKYYRKDSSP